MLPCLSIQFAEGERLRQQSEWLDEKTMSDQVLRVKAPLSLSPCVSRCAAALVKTQPWLSYCSSSSRFAAAWGDYTTLQAVPYIWKEGERNDIFFLYLVWVDFSFLSYLKQPSGRIIFLSAEKRLKTNKGERRVNSQ